MDDSFYDEFLSSGDTLRVYAGGVLVFWSQKDSLVPLLEYLDEPGEKPRGVVMMDRVVGNAAALLMIRAGCREAYSPLGSKLAAETLDKWGVACHFDKVVPYIRREDSEGMCPMEEMSLGQSPSEFLASLVARDS
jgi:hypothetical protein